ncbi:cytochrome c oxidase assembly protein [Planococcus sp. ISL-109]|uniref:cytochrome c oxidase assembly protein n=1 Tax=Planococcus sp. ISL-109 TaxID=2819166 RepID=UPI001BEC8C38|nr:cytochrome c oxidase assembly protein [Planococcus sp. ISL-109]MBT2582161.1 cytochrome c oxidase assembly protein [Planococcus sp. ISL-109]
MSHHYLGSIELWFSVTAALALAWALIFYPMLAIWTNERFKKWPVRRYLFWFAGVTAAGAALVGPLSEQAHTSFSAHMIGHLLLGMLAPLLLLYGKPMTLLLRSLPRDLARLLSRILNSRYIHFISHPVVASLLSIGGLYILYRTDIFIWMHQSTIVYAIVHIHFLVAGYLFMMSILYADLTPHRYSFRFRAIVLILALAGHKILAKSLYAMPPAGITTTDGEMGAMIMYYGGNLIDLAIILLFCYSWYKATAPGRVVRAI